MRKEKNKEIVGKSMLELAEVCCRFNSCRLDNNFSEWNSAFYFPHSELMIDPRADRKDENERTVDSENTAKSGKAWNEQYMKLMVTEQMGAIASSSKPSKFFSCELKSENELVIGSFDYDRRFNSRLLIRDAALFLELTLSGNLYLLTKETEAGAATILNSDTIFQKVYKLIADYALYPILDEYVLSVFTMFNFIPKVTDIFLKFRK